MGPHVTDQLSAYMDDELRAPERALVEAHLRGCAACARHLEELRALDAAARALPLAVPDDYFETFSGRLRRRLEGARPAPRRLAPAWTLAAAAAVFLAVLTPRLLRETRAPVAPARPAPTLAGRDAAPAPPAMASKTDSTLADARPRAPRAEETAPAVAETRRLAQGARPQATPPPAVPAAPPPPPAATAAREADQLEALGYATAPAETAPPEPAAQARREAEFSAPLEEQKERRDKAARGVAATRGRAAGSPASDPRFEMLLRRTVSSAEEARALREAWRAYAEDEPSGPRADEARVRAVEAGAEAWRRGKDERDRARTLKDGREYLERPDALQATRVRSALRPLSP